MKYSREGVYPSSLQYIISYCLLELVMVKTVSSYLCVERVSAELEDALELVSVGLPHRQCVLAPLEDLDLM